MEYGVGDKSISEENIKTLESLSQEEINEYR